MINKKNTEEKVEEKKESKIGRRFQRSKCSIPHKVRQTTQGTHTSGHRTLGSTPSKEDVSMIEHPQYNIVRLLKEILKELKGLRKDLKK